MSGIEVEGPDGAIHEFPDGTSPDIIKGAMAKVYAPAPADAGMGEAAVRGLGQGLTLGHADEMAGLGANSPLPGAGAASKTTFGALSAPDVILGGAKMLAQKVAPSIFGAGDNTYTQERNRVRSGNDQAQAQHPYAYGAGEVAGAVAPSLLPGGPVLGATGGLLSRVGQTAALGAGLGAVQGAGQAKETENIPGDVTRGAMIGGVTGAAAPVLAAGIGKVVSPFQIAPERQALIKTLENEGVQLTAGQKTGSKPLQYLESTLGDMPGAGGVASEIQRKQGQQFTQAALRRTGTDAPLATPDVMDAAFSRMGQKFDDLAARNTLKMDAPFAQDFGGAVSNYIGMVPPGNRVPMVGKMVDDVMQIARTGGTLDGAAYQSLRSRLDKLARGTSDNELRTFANETRSALDNAMERSIPMGSPDAGAWREVRNQYRNMMPLEKAASRAGEANAQGFISPSNLRNSVVQQNARSYVRGNGDFAELARAGEAIMKPLPNSGTAPRQNMQNLITMLSGGGGMAVGGLGGALAGAAAPAVAGRLLFSTPVQKLLANQAGAKVAPRLGLLAAQPLRQQTINADRRRGLLASR